MSTSFLNAFLIFLSSFYLLSSDEDEDVEVT